MNILFLENEGSWRGQCLLKLNEGATHKVDTFTETQLNDPVEKLAELIVKDFIFVDLFIINVNMISGNQDRSACWGIKLIKLLRLHGLNQQCILYSFLSREQLMELSPENLIVFSEGLTYIRLPYDFKQIDLVASSKKIAPTNLTAYLKAESRLPDDRHFFANWWGALQLWNVYKKVNDLNDDLKNSIQHQLFPSSKEIGSYQGLLARYLYGHEVQKFSNVYIQSKREKHNDYSHFNLPPQTYTEHIAQLDQKIETAITEHERYRDILDAITTSNNNWQKFLLSWSGKPKEISTKIRHFEIGINEATTEKEHIQRFLELKEYIGAEERQYITEKENLILERVKVIEESKKESYKLKEDNTFGQLLHEKSPKICYIDDQAEEGWAGIFQLMIYGETKPDCFQVIQPSKASELEPIIQKCFEHIQTHNPDLIILDLRLLGETGTISNPTELSGFKVLHALKSGYKHDNGKKYYPISCPLMIVTASNKVNTYQFITNEGADAYWIKEGLDNHFSLDESADNYFDFIAKTYVLCCSPEFKMIREMKSKFTEFRQNKTYWWESPKRFQQLNDDRVTINNITRKIIFGIIGEAIRFIEVLVQNKLNHSWSIDYERLISSMVVVRLFLAIEIIHEEINSTNFPTKHTELSTRIFKHHPVSHRLNKLLEIRNKAVHHDSILLGDVKQFVDYLMGYLSNSPSAQSH